MATMVRGPQTTENIPASRRVRDVDKNVARLDPNAAPLTVILVRARERAVSNSKYEWIEQALPPQWDAINNGAGYASGATSVVVDNAAYFAVGNIVNVPRTGEKFRVTAVVTGTNTLTIVRGVGSTAAAALLDNDDLQIIGTAYVEGSGAPAELATVETYPFNLTQIFKTAVGETGTQQASENYVGPGRPYLRADAMILHRIQMERTLLFGERNLDNSDPANPIRYTGGLLYFLTSNIKDFGGTVAEPEIETWMESVFDKTGGSDTRVWFVSPGVLSAVEQLAAGRIEMVPSDTTYGIKVTQWKTGHGNLMIVKHRFLQNSPTPAGVAGGPFGYYGYGIALEPDRLMYCPLRGRTTKLEMDIQAPDADAWKDQFKTEAGWAVKNPELHGIAKNITG